MPEGVWSTIATAEMDLACCVAVGDMIYVGTDDARVLRVEADGTDGGDTWQPTIDVDSDVHEVRVHLPMTIKRMAAASRRVNQQFGWLPPLAPDNHPPPPNTGVSLITVAAAAGLIPALRAARVNPIRALRHE